MADTGFEWCDACNDLQAGGRPYGAVFFMSCYHPISLPSKHKAARFGYLVVPCGRCIGCRLDYAGMWALRCAKEAELYQHNAFITLTYNKENLPWGEYYPTLDKGELQRFWKRLRKEYKGERIRYFACGEYGERRHRPHYHACVFGIDFKDKYHCDSNPKTGHKYYHSDKLNRIWGNGDCFIGDVTYESASYVARYLISKKTGDQAKYYTDRRIEPEFVRMSQKPGIGADWFYKYRDEIIQHDSIVHEGRERGIPRYFSKLIERYDLLIYEDLKSKRKKRSEEFYWKQKDLGASNLAVKEKVKKAQMGLYTRGELD